MGRFTASLSQDFLSTVDGGRKLAAFPKKQTVFVQSDLSDKEASNISSVKSSARAMLEFEKGAS
jgi:hypothetical protein